MSKTKHRTGIYHRGPTETRTCSVCWTTGPIQEFPCWEPPGAAVCKGCIADEFTNLRTRLNALVKAGISAVHSPARNGFTVVYGEVVEIDYADWSDLNQALAAAKEGMTRGEATDEGP